MAAVVCKANQAESAAFGNKDLTESTLTTDTVPFQPQKSKTFPDLVFISLFS